MQISENLRNQNELTTGQRLGAFAVFLGGCVALSGLVAVIIQLGSMFKDQPSNIDTRGLSDTNQKAVIPLSSVLLDGEVLIYSAFLIGVLFFRCVQHR